MNYANMIEEKGLKKGFIIATLISTIIGTFTTGINLYDRIRERSRQDRTDSSQDRRIEAVERRLDRGDSRERARHRHDDYSHGHDAADAYEALASSPHAIRREYERLRDIIGPRFAHGDDATRVQLQAMVIDLQASVIDLLQDALEGRARANGSSYPYPRDVSPRQLAAAAARARNGSIRALQDQYQRMLAAAPPRAGLDRDLYREDRSLRLSDDRTRADELFCPYARQLQKDPLRPLDVDVDPQVYGRSLNSLSSSSSSVSPVDGSVDGDVARPTYCPSCAGRLDIAPERAWKMHKPVVVDHIEEGVQRAGHGSGPGSTIVRGVDIVRDRVFVLSNHFVVKCHRAAEVVDNEHEGPGRTTVATILLPEYACCLCERRRQLQAKERRDAPRDARLPPPVAVVVCSSMWGLVNHVNEKHSVDELLADPDVREIRHRHPGRR